jgi:hypothetical protein
MKCPHSRLGSSDRCSQCSEAAGLIALVAIPDSCVNARRMINGSLDPELVAAHAARVEQAATRQQRAHAIQNAKHHLRRARLSRTGQHK